MSADKDAKLKALKLTMDRMDKAYGKGTVMKMGVRMRLIDAFDSTSTNKVARPSPMAFSRVLETASKGQSPKS